MTKRRAHILVVDDEGASRDGLAQLLEHEGFHVGVAVDGRDAMSQLHDAHYDAVVSDIKMPNMTGLELTKSVKDLWPDLPVVLMTAYADVETAVAGMRAGAYHFVTKPLDFGALLVTVDRSLKDARLRSEVVNLRDQLEHEMNGGVHGLYGVSEPMQAIRGLARRVAGARATVLLTGESGTGKGQLARAIHRMGPRAAEPFLTLHCASISESLLESELFGHERGAFTGADKRRLGRFERASRGTIFLDEVGEIPLATQVKLLRVLQDREFERVGGNETLKTGARVIAATNQNLREAVRNKEFREDLFYRLNVVQIEVPPLRVRGNDVLILANRFLARQAADNDRGAMALSEAAMGVLLQHPWPGNVRELENAIERAVVLSDGPTIHGGDLPLDLSVTGEQAGGVTEGPRIPGATMADLERYALEKTLEFCGGSTSRAAEILGISVRKIQYRLQSYRANAVSGEP